MPVSYIPHQTEKGPSPVDMLLARLSESSALLSQQKLVLSSSSGLPDLGTTYKKDAGNPAGNSDPVIPPTISGSTTPTSQVSGKSVEYADACEMALLKQQLEAANTKIAKMDEELSQNRITKHTLDQAMGSASEFDFPLTQHKDDMKGSLHNNSFNSLSHSANRGTEGWNVMEDSHSDHSEPYVMGQAPHRVQGMWRAPRSSGMSSACMTGFPASDASIASSNTTWNAGRPYMTGGPNSGIPGHGFGGYPGGVRGLPPPPIHLDAPRGPNNYYNDSIQFSTDRRAIQPPNRPASAVAPRFGSSGFVSAYNGSMAPDSHGLTPPMTPLTPTFPYQTNGMYGASAMFSGPGTIGSRLSPTAAEFNLRGGLIRNDPWNSQVYYTSSVSLKTCY